MGINLFVLILIVASIFITNIKQEEHIKKVVHKDLPLVVFNNSTFYLMDNKEVKKMVKSSQFQNYKNKDELYDATISIKNKYNKTDILSGQYILKKDNIYRLYSDVKIQMNGENKIDLSSDFLKYDINKNILSNNDSFILNYNNSVVVGDNLFYNDKLNIIKAKNIHMKIKKEVK